MEWIGVPLGATAFSLFYVLIGRSNLGDKGWAVLTWVAWIIVMLIRRAK